MFHFIEGFLLAGKITRTFPLICSLFILHSEGTQTEFFPLAEVNITLPNANQSLPPILRLSVFPESPIIDYYIENDEGFFKIDRSIIFPTSHFFHQVKGDYRVKIKTKTNVMTINLTLLNTSINCQESYEEICFWRKSSYQVIAGQQPVNLGQLSASFYGELCPEFRVKYNVIRGKEFIEIIRQSNSEDFWMLRTKQPLLEQKRVTIRCIIRNNGTEKEIDKDFAIPTQFLKADDGNAIAENDRFSSLIAMARTQDVTSNNDSKHTLYTEEPIKVWSSARDWIRVTEPVGKIDNKTKFIIEFDHSIPVFGITELGGIIYIRNSSYLEKISGTDGILNVTWYTPHSRNYQLLNVSIIKYNGNKMMCEELKDGEFCAQYDNPMKCVHKCGIGSGRRKGVYGCEWRKGNNKFSSNYTTCSSNIDTCPDQNCDPLEKLNSHLCPQDCAEEVTGSMTTGPFGGINAASGLCTCDKPNRCLCKVVDEKYFKKSRYDVTSTKMNESFSSCDGTCIAIISVTLIIAISLGMFLVYYSTYRKVSKRGAKKSLKEDLVHMNYDDYLSRPLQSDECFQQSSVSHSDYFDKKWEFPRHRLTIEECLGEGQFGRVVKARADGINGQDGPITVAVKTLKKHANENELADLISEYQLLKEVDHPNVIKLLGACTTPDGPLFIIIEYAEHGSLLNYLRKRKPTTNPNESEESYLEPKVEITPRQILTFAWQIAKGMSYLAEMKLVHRDLAARNILVTQDVVCKISDFGLTRDIYEDDTYLKRSKGRVPIKWMAIESLKDHIYTTKSDVWSYGIVLWELVNTGDAPYPGITIQSVFSLIQEGYRMERPLHCSEALYRIMRDCWHDNPSGRPTFKALVARLEEMLSEGTDYLDLNPRFIENKAYFMQDKTSTTTVKWTFDFYDRPQTCTCVVGECTCQVTIIPTKRYYNELEISPEDNNVYVAPDVNLLKDNVLIDKIEKVAKECSV